MRKFLFFALLFILGTSVSYSQKKQINNAKAIIKSGKDYETAEKMMLDLLKDAKNKDNEKIYLTLFESLRKQYEQGNEKLYLKQQYDTAALFNITKKMFAVLESLDSIDVKNSKDPNKLEYRKKHSAFLHPYRRNLFSGGGYFARKKDYKTAFTFYDMYIDCARQPLFEKYNYGETDKNITMAAYWSLYCGFKADDHKLTLKYADLAMKEKSTLEYTLQFLVETYSEIKDKDKCIETLEDGFEKYPRSPYFFTRLSDYYNEELCDYAKALSLAEKALKADGENILFLFAKSNALLNLGRYEECINVSKQVLGKDNALKDAYLNIGLSFFNLAITTTDKKESIDQYSHSMNYMEMYRKMAPEDIERWGSVLYNIYLNLNMGSKFDEIDRLLNKK